MSKGVDAVLRITTSAVDGTNRLEFLERQSGTAVSAWRISAAIIQELTEKIQRAAGDRAAGAGR